MIISNQDLHHRNMRGKTLSGNEYRECSFNYADMRDVHMENGVLLSNSFIGTKLIGAVFRLSCTQGSGNTLDDTNTCLFLYWLLHTFDVPHDIHDRIEEAIGSERMRRVRKIFEQPPQL